jgi:hypothetical protein
MKITDKMFNTSATKQVGVAVTMCTSIWEIHKWLRSPVNQYRCVKTTRSGLMSFFAH